MERGNRAVLLFIVLSLGLSVCYWGMVELWPKGSLPYPIELLLWGLFRGFGPAFAGFVAAFYKDGPRGLKALLLKVGLLKVAPRFYLLGFAWPILAIAIGIIAVRVTTHLPLDPAMTFTPSVILVFFVMAIFDGPLGEEIGWRGLLLPELLRKRHAVIASVIVGCIWWIWHIPLYLADGRTIPWIPYLFQTIALSLIFGWFFLRTRESIFFAIYLHNMSNYAIYLSRQFFPQLQNTQIDNYVFLGIILALGATAAISMNRNNSRQMHKPDSYA